MNGDEEEILEIYGREIIPAMREVLRGWRSACALFRLAYQGSTARIPLRMASSAVGCYGCVSLTGKRSPVACSHP